MIQNFDYFNYSDPPNVTLCNPNLDKLYSITKYIHDTKLNIRFNASSGFNFTIPKSIDGGLTTVEAYEYMKVKKIILIDNVGYFMITSAKEVSEGEIPKLEVECSSIDSELSYKKITTLSGTCKFYDSVNPSTEPSQSLLGYILSLIPNWSVGEVDASLELKYRTFDISDATIYDFLLNNMETAYECVFFFDIIEKKIYARTIDNAVTETDIFVSFDNLVKSSEFDEMSDEIVTALHVYGGDALDIRSVNPLGTNIIYDFSYYKNTDWMSGSLVSALTNWEDLIESNQSGYTVLLESLMNYNSDLTTLQGELAELQIEYADLEIVLKAAIESSGNVALAQANLSAKQLEIDAKNSQIASKNTQIAAITSDITVINSELSFANNFTESEFLELSNYIIENTYQNENIIILDSYTPVQIQNTKQELYNQAKNVLGRISVPRYEFSIDSANFVNIKDFSYYTNQLIPGAGVTIETTTYPIYSVVLEIELSYDNPENFKLTLSNRLRLDNNKFQYSDLVGQVVKTGTSVSFDKPKWSNWATDYKNDVTEFITSSLNTTNNQLINSSNQEIVINGSGLRGKHYNSLTSTYDNTQVWLTSNILAFTDDNWSTSKLALGQTTVNGVTKFGLIADYVVGKLLIGSQLNVANETNSFIVDANGATLTNAIFSVTKNNLGVINTISIDPSNGMKITSGATTKFIADLAGNLTINGTINSTSGLIGGWTIANNGLESGSNHIRPNDIVLGGLTISGTTASFDGNIYARNLDNGGVTNSKLSSSGFDASKFTVGSMSGNRIYGGTISWPGGYIGMDTLGKSSGILAYGAMSIIANNGLYLNGAVGSGVTVEGSGGLDVVASNLTVAGYQVATQNWVTSRGYITGTSGRNVQYVVNETNGNSTWTFNNGVVSSISYSGVTRGVSTTVNPYSQNTGNWTFLNGIRTV